MLALDNMADHASLNDTVSLIRHSRMNYCLCGVHLPSLKPDSSSMHNSQIHNSSIDYTSCRTLPMPSPNHATQGQEERKAPVPHSKVKITKRNAKYLAELEGYSYEIQERIDAQTGKLTPLYICKYDNSCNQEFQRSWNSLDHVRMHYNIRPFACTYCDLKFTQKGNLNKHMLKHLIPDVKDRKKCKCDLCGKGYTKRSNYTVSLINHRTILFTLLKYRLLGFD